jgi:hypothetical protein
LSIDGLNNGGTPGLLGISINATNMQSQFASLWLAFAPTNVLAKATLLKAKSSVVITSNNAVVLMDFLLPLSSTQLNHVGRGGDSNESGALILIFAVVAIVLVSVIVYAIRT